MIERVVISLYRWTKTKVLVESELSVLWSLLFEIVVNVIAKNAREGLMDDILFFMSESLENLGEKVLK